MDTYQNQNVTVKICDQQAHTCVFFVRNEGHTLGNLVRMQMLKYEQVRFAAYKVPHPLKHKMVLRVQSTSNTTPRSCVVHAIDALDATLTHLIKKCEGLQDC